MAQTQGQIKKVLRDGEYRINAEPTEMDKKDTCTHEEGWRRYKYKKGVQFYRCRWCGEISD